MISEISKMDAEAKKIIIADKRKNAGEAIYHAVWIFCFKILMLLLSLECEIGSLDAGKKNLDDHHQQPEHFDYVYSNTYSCRLAQMVYHFIEALGKEAFGNKERGNFLYTGIMTKYGGFPFSFYFCRYAQNCGEFNRKGADPSMITSNTCNVIRF